MCHDPILPDAESGSVLLQVGSFAVSLDTGEAFLSLGGRGSDVDGSGSSSFAQVVPVSGADASPSFALRLCGRLRLLL